MVTPVNQLNNIYGYLRVSTREQVKSGVSLKVQKRKIKKFVKEKYNREVTEFFIDDGVSGTKALLERPGSKALTDVIDRYDVVICTKLDRLSRSTSDLLQIIPTLQDIGITLFFCEQFGEMPIVYPKKEEKKGLRSRFDMNEMANQIMLMVLSAVAEIEHANICDRFDDGKLDWAERGYHIGGGVPYGYSRKIEYHGNKKRVKLVPIPEQLEIIETIRRLHKRKLGCKKIATQVNSLHHGAEMTYSRVRRILARQYQGMHEAA